MTEYSLVLRKVEQKESLKAYLLGEQLGLRQAAKLGKLMAVNLDELTEIPLVDLSVAMSVAKKGLMLGSLRVAKLVERLVQQKVAMLVSNWVVPMAPQLVCLKVENLV